MNGGCAQIHKSPAQAGRVLEDNLVKARDKAPACCEPANAERAETAGQYHYVLLFQRQFLKV